MESERLESHFATCDDCRESLSLFARLSSDTTASEPVTGQELKDQTASVIALIKQEEFNRKIQKQPIRQSEQKAPVFYFRLAAAAVVVFTVTLIASVWLIDRTSQTEQAIESIALAMKEERLLEPRISGNLEWSRYTATRGREESSSDSKRAQLLLEDARNKLDAEKASAKPEVFINLSRAYLAEGTRKGAETALAILRELETRGDLPAEALNDLGVALLQLDNYDEAITYFGRVLEKKPDFNEALFNRALAESRIGRSDEARRDWKEFINRVPDSGWKREAEKKLDMLDTNPQGIKF